MRTLVDSRSQELEWVRSARAGSREAFDRLVATELLPGLRGAARRLTGNDADADDLVQETLASAFRSLGSLQHPEAWRRWIYQILVRRNHDRLLRRRLRRDRSGVADEPGPLDMLLRAEARTIARESLEGLKEPHRTVLTLRFLHEMSLEAVARRVEKPLGTVKYLVHEGLIAFEAAMKRRME